MLVTYSIVYLWIVKYADDTYLIVPEANSSFSDAVSYTHLTLPTKRIV